MEKYFKKLLGERIYLSPRVIEDAEIFTKWLNDFEVTDYIGKSCSIMTVDAEKRYLEQHTNDESSFAIIDLKTDKMVGVVGIENIDHLHRIGTLGIFIGDENYRDNGYGTEAIRLVLDYGFNYLNLNNIDLNVFDFNKRAIACYEKCGFKISGKRRKSYFLDGKYYDNLQMDILAEEFKEKYIKNRINH